MNFIEFNGIGDVLTEGIEEESIFFVLTKTGYETLLEGLPTDLGDLSNEFLQIKSNITDNKTVITQLQESLASLNSDMMEIMSKVSEINVLKDTIINLESDRDQHLLRIQDLEARLHADGHTSIYMDIRDYIREGKTALEVAKKFLKDDLYDYAKSQQLTVTKSMREAVIAQILIDFLSI